MDLILPVSGLQDTHRGFVGCTLSFTTLVLLEVDFGRLVRRTSGIFNFADIPFTFYGNVLPLLRTRVARVGTFELISFTLSVGA